MDICIYVERERDGHVHHTHAHVLNVVNGWMDGCMGHALPRSDPSEFLKLQLTSEVLWEQTIKQMVILPPFRAVNKIILCSQAPGPL